MTRGNAVPFAQDSSRMTSSGPIGIPAFESRFTGETEAQPVDFLGIEILHVRRAEWFGRRNYRTKDDRRPGR